MSNPILTISSISTENNYIRIDGAITESKEEKGRLITSYYPKKSTSFNIEQEAQVTEKGTIYTNYFVISNHMGVGTIRVSELFIENITQGAEGKAFTPQTFTEFMTESTGV